MSRRPSLFIDMPALLLAVAFWGFPNSAIAEEGEALSHSAMVDASILDVLDALLSDLPILSERVGVCIDEESAHGGLVGRLLLERLIERGHVVRGPDPDDCGAVSEDETELRIAVNELVLTTRLEGRSFLGGKQMRRECRVGLALGVGRGGDLIQQERRTMTRSDVIDEASLGSLEGGEVRAVDINDEAPWILEPLITIGVSAGMFYLFFTSRDDE